METELNNTDVSDQLGSMSANGAYEEPRGELERSIALLWMELFRLEKIGRNDNFFELGGNSLMGMDLSEMFTFRLGLEVPVLEIFRYPTVGELAQFIEGPQS